ncbi:TBC1 domain family member 24 isoform X1 [Oryzias latipes]|uniref:TBC1 domain family member 24 isoform X1 n=1 Tax=Oryzias latipes TaxID=8090 RepID=UPI0005CBA588|nr:TBC1 domain family member 24 isoform X1 [Oryzias latipes]
MRLEMIQVSRTPGFSNLGNMNSFSHISTDQDFSSMATDRRQRSRSQYDSEESKSIESQKQTEEISVRPRSRSFYSFEMSEQSSNHSMESFLRSSPLRQKASTVFKSLAPKKEDVSGVHVTSRGIKPKLNKHSHSSELDGGKSSAKPMITISELDSWDICSSSGMKYGQFVDWEKIDPESASKYQQILNSEHKQLKAMGRQGFWAMPHTLRAKAYYHIIHCFTCSKANAPDREVYYELAKKLFGEQKLSNHPVPEYMEDGDIPRYCLNKAGLNSVKKILLCIGNYFPEMNYCPILPALVSVMLHFSEDEAECFFSVSRLICYKDTNKRYIDQTFLTYRASCMTFGDIANRCCKGIRKLIASSHQNLFEFYSDWIMWIFADLPFTYAIRVLDVYLLEGYKVLYRVALALLDLYKVSVSSRVADVQDFRTDMKRFVQSVDRYCTVENLLERAFMIPMATRAELNLLFNANKDSLIQKGVSKDQKRQTVETEDFTNFFSSIVTKVEMRVIWAWIPERFALFSPVQLFSTAEHERSLASLYSHVEGHEPVVLIIKTMDEEVFGAFLSTDVRERNQHNSQTPMYFGTGECFVFTLRPSMERYQRAMVYILTRIASPQQVSGFGNSPMSSPTGIYQNPGNLNISCSASLENSLTAKEPKRSKDQYASMFIAGDDRRLIIGGDGGHALCLQGDLEGGCTEPCDTFMSNPLCKGNFQIQSLEVWGIQNSVCLSPSSSPQ